MTPSGKTGRLVFRNARLIDPASGLDVKGGLLVENGRIADMGPRLFNDAEPRDPEVIDCKGLVLAPGLIYCRVFTGEPGSEHRESLASASEAAAAGGVTTIVTMPNTNPVIDEPSLVDFIRRRAQATAKVRVATPISTCSEIRLTSRSSAMSEAISTPRFIGPGCMTSAPGFAAPSFSRSRP